MTNERPGPDAHAPDGSEPDPYSYHSPYWVPQAFHPQGAPAPMPPPRRSRRGLVAVGAGFVAAGAVVAAVVATSSAGSVSGLGATAQAGTSQTQTQTPSTQMPSTQSPTTAPTQQAPQTVPFPTQRGGSQTSASVATAAQEKGIVVIDTVLGYQDAEAAGTGMVLTSSGEVLTNNHVVDGATKIVVTIASTGKRYTATVVGTDPTDDVAVLQLSNASGLQTANIDTTPTPAVGDTVIAVGNAGGTGTLTAASGKVTALKQSITASDEDGTNSEKLSGLIQVDAAVVAGDSGGPLYDSSGEVIGIDTAAGTTRSGTTTGYAIQIDKALSIAAQIENGTETSKIHIGARGLLGVTVATVDGGAQVQGIVSGGAAAAAGIVPGDVITSLNGKAVTSGTALQTTITDTKAGEKVSVSWTDTSGGTHTATVTLGTGPAD